MNHMNQSHRMSLAILLGLLSVQASAQNVPNSGDVLRQIRPPIPSEPPAPPIPEVKGAPAAAPMQALPGGGRQVEVASFRIEGNREITTAALNEQIKGEGGKLYTLQELESIAIRLTRYYRAKGYFVARVYVPAQELNDKVVTLRVVEGNYGRFILKNQSLVRDDIVQGLLDDVKRYDIVSLDTLERAMLIINDTPGVKVVKADVMPGEAVGTSDFSIGTEATSKLDGYALLDNYGSRYTGRTRLSGNLDWNSPTGRGDRLSVSGMLTDGDGLYNGRLSYSALVSPHGTRMQLALSRTRYDLSDQYAVLGATGTADSIDLGLTTPFTRTRALSIDGGLLLTSRLLKDEISATDTSTRKRSYGLTASISARREAMLWGQQGLTFAAASITAGQLDFRDAESEALDAAGPHTQGTYAKINLSLTQSMLLPKQFTLTASGSGQATLTNRNLDGSERMSVSGLSAVVGYPIGELSGDDAALARIELSRPLAQVGGGPLIGSVFTDYGWARAVHPVAGVGDARTLGDIGIGFNFSAPQGGIAKLQIVSRIKGGSPLSENMPKTVARFQVGWVF